MSLRSGIGGRARRTLDPAPRSSDKFGDKKLTQLFQSRREPGNDSGNYLTPATNDGVERTFSDRQVGPQLLLVNVRLTSNDYLAQWCREAYLLARTEAQFTCGICRKCASQFFCRSLRTEDHPPGVRAHIGAMHGQPRLPGTVRIRIPGPARSPGCFPPQSDRHSPKPCRTPASARA